MSEDVASQKKEGSEEPSTAASEDSASSSQSSSHHTRAGRTIQGEPPPASPVFAQLYDQLDFLLEQKETLMINNIHDTRFHGYYKMWSADASLIFRRLVVMHKRHYRAKPDKSG